MVWWRRVAWGWLLRQRGGEEGGESRRAESSLSLARLRSARGTSERLHADHSTHAPGTPPHTHPPRASFTSSSSTHPPKPNPKHARTPPNPNSYLAGVINRAPDTHGAIPESKWWKHDGAFGRVLPFAQWPRYAQLKANVPAVKRLLDTVDFYGISNYARTPATISPVDLESGTRKYEAELAEMGINLKAQISKPGKFWIWNEFAIGGGISECGNVTASNGPDAGLFPWLGSTSTYTAATDPWKNAGVREYMRDYYRAGLKLIGMGGIDYKVCAVCVCVRWCVCKGGGGGGAGCS